MAKGVLAKGSNTTNLFQHLHEHHPSEYAEIASKSTTTAQRGESSKTMQPTILDTLSNSTKYGSDSAQAKQLNKAVTYFIAKDAMPLYTVEKPGFRYLISKLNPRYSLPSRRHFSDYMYEIPRLYGQVRDSVAALVRQANTYAAT